MDTRELTIQDLLKRVNLKLPLNQAIKNILKDYNLGTLKTVDPLFVGHEELNVIITTTKGKYGIKLMNKNRSKKMAAGLVRAMLKFDQAGVPVTRLHPSKNNQYLYELKPKIGKGFLFIADYFQGRTFHETQEITQDLKTITKSVALIHQLSFKTAPEYDFWLPQYLPQEFDTRGKYLKSEDYHLVKQIVRIFNAIDFTQCSQTVGHFDLHRDNIKKNKSGQICFFDLATVDRHYAILDLGSFIGFFLDPKQSVAQHRKRFNLILAEYLQHRHLNQYEKDHLFDCVKIIFASNVLGASYLINAENDDTEETYKWYRFGKWGLQTFSHSPSNQWPIN